MAYRLADRNALDEFSEESLSDSDYEEEQVEPEDEYEEDDDFLFLLFSSVVYKLMEFIASYESGSEAETEEVVKPID
uniref:Uncharacterized protein n=1 Tax=Ditylenchus dipsaci TaxID=166011 RepID=A0A915CNZ0_9BILA